MLLVVLLHISYIYSLFFVALYGSEMWTLQKEDIFDDFRQLKYGFGGV